MNPYLVFVLTVLVLAFVLDLWVEWLNLRHVSPELPDEFRDVYDAAKYAESQRYLGVTTRFGMWQASVMTPLLIVFLLVGGFNWVDTIARMPGWGEIPTGLLFGGLLVLGGTLIGLPWSLYETFGIEARFGFNKTTPMTFVLDMVKGLALGAVLGGVLFAGIIWFFLHAGHLAWLYAWLGTTALQVVLMYLAPVVIMPLFNKFEPLPDGELRQAIEAYAREQQFQLSGIFTMDGSKRSTKANAFFVGFGKHRRIVLYDTLVERQSVAELVAILAHEMGHYKRHHILKFMLLKILELGVMFWILSLFINAPRLFEAFGMAHVSVYASIVFFGFLYSPISTLLSIGVNALSRKFEFEADHYAATTGGSGEPLISALKKLSVDNLSNLTPHPLKVVLEYSHPPVSQRIAALRH